MKIHFVVVVIIIPPVIGVLTADIKKKKKIHKILILPQKVFWWETWPVKIFLLILGEKECFKMMLYHILNNQIS